MKNTHHLALTAWFNLAIILCAPNLRAQSPPTITTQPVSQTNYAGTPAIFNVTAAGTGPFTYQWNYSNGASTNFPANIGYNIIISVISNDPPNNFDFNYPLGVAVDPSGSVYVAASLNNSIRKVTLDGVQSIVVGNGTASYGGDGGPAPNASLSDPGDVALDVSGNLYVADWNNHRIRKVGTNGVITTVAGNGTPAYAGDGGQATNASLKYPEGVAVDASGNLYIGDTSNHRVRKVDTNGIITTVAGNGTTAYAGDGGQATNASLFQPSGIALDSAGNLYVAGEADNRVRKVDTSGIITTVAGNGTAAYAGDGGQATNASLKYPNYVAVDASGNLYIADSHNNRVRRVDTSGLITTVAGNGTTTYVNDGGAATNACLSGPCGLAFDATGNLFVADSGDNRVREICSAPSSLVLTNVSVASSGNYWVVVTGPGGSMTSSVVSLTVTIPPPQILTIKGSLGFVNNQFGFHLSGLAGQTIIVDGSTDLANWIPLFTNTASGSADYVSDPASTNFSRRYYRARVP